MSDVCMKEGLGFCSCLGLRAFRRVVRVEVMKICVHVAIATGCIAVAHPSFAEVSTLVPKQGCFEVSNSRLQDGELSLKFWAEGGAVPTCEGGIEVRKGLKDGGAELGRGNAISVVSSNRKGSEQRDKDGENWPIFHLVFSCLLPFWVVWLCGGYSMKRD